jgi:hypothetical protein
MPIEPAKAPRQVHVHSAGILRSAMRLNFEVVSNCYDHLGQELTCRLNLNPAVVRRNAPFVTFGVCASGTRSWQHPTGAPRLRSRLLFL